MMESTASLKVARRSPENMCRLVTDNSASICCMQDQDSTGQQARTVQIQCSKENKACCTLTPSPLFLRFVYFVYNHWSQNNTYYVQYYI